MPRPWAGFGQAKSGHHPRVIESVEFVTVQCPDCGPGLVPLEVVHLRINRENDRASLAFPCAICGVRNALALSAHSVIVLRDAGIDPVYWTYPRELRQRASEFRESFPARSVDSLVRELETDIESFLRSA